MTITAKYPSQCAACGGKITPGEKIEWEKGQKARHASCPASGVALNAAYQPKGETRRTNSKAAPCTFCGTMLAPGKGNLWWGEDGCCPNPRHFDEGGWHVTCFDRDACQARVETLAGESRQARIDAKAASAKAAADREQARWDAARAAGTLVEMTHIPGMAMVAEGTPACQAYIRAVAARAVLQSGWAWMPAGEIYDVEFIAVLRAYWRESRPGWARTDGHDTDDATLIALHAHSGIAHHIEPRLILGSEPR